MPLKSILAPPLPDVLEIVATLMRGARLSRRELAAMGVSLPTADRWIRRIARLPGMRLEREGKTTWIRWAT